MRNHFFCIICTILALSFSVITLGFASVLKEGKIINDSTIVKNSAPKKSSTAKALFFHYLDDVYQAAGLSQAGLDSMVFEKAMVGYYNLRTAKLLPANSSIITVVDFDKPGAVKRLWIVDLQQKKILLNTKIINNQLNNDQQQSNIGFYLTAGVENDENGQALQLKGVDDGFNNSARKNQVAIIGMEHVSNNNTNFPAVANAVLTNIISLVKGNNMLFINRNDDNYTSIYLDEDNASKFAFADSSFNLVKDVFGN